MSWSATKYAWKCSHKDADGHELVKGSVKLLMLAVAYKIPIGRYESDLVSLRDFHALTGLTDRQVRSCRWVLIDLGELEHRSEGPWSTYLFPKMLGPLFATSTPEKISVQVGKDFRSSRKRFPGAAEKISDHIGENAGGVLSLDLLSTTVLTTTTPEAEVEAAIEIFCNWFLTQYPIHRHGVLYQVDPAIAETVVRGLLMGRSVARLQAMALEMWAAPSDDFILGSDYSLHILKHRATKLEARVVARDRACAISAPPVQGSTWAAVCRSLKDRVHRDTFHTWFAPLTLVEDHADLLTVEAPTADAREWILKHFSDVLQASVEEARPGARIVVRAAVTEARG